MRGFLYEFNEWLKTNMNISIFYTAKIKTMIDRNLMGLLILNLIRFLCCPSTQP